jgi:hypothetical protein
MKNKIAFALCLLLFSCMDTNTTNIRQKMYIKDMEVINRESENEPHICRFWAGNAKETNSNEWMSFCAPCIDFTVDSEVQVVNPKLIKKSKEQEEILKLLD